MRELPLPVVPLILADHGRQPRGIDALNLPVNKALVSQPYVQFNYNVQ